MRALAVRGLGRHSAYDLMQEIVEVVYRDGIEFHTILKNLAAVQQYLSEEDIDDLTDPNTNLGLVQAQIDATLTEIGFNRPEASV